MNLGRLPRHYIIDVFKRIKIEQQTIKLRISYNREIVCLYFTDGYVAFSHPAYQKDKIGNRLVKDGIVTREQIISALARQRELADVDRNKRIGTILVDMGFITKKGLQGFIKKEILYAVMDILEADDVSVVFLPHMDALKSDITATIDIEHLIEEKSRYIKNVKSPGIEGVSPDDVFVLAVGPERMRRLSNNAWKLLVLLDGKRDVAQLTSVSGLQSAQVVKIITDLLKQSIIKRIEAEPISKPKRMYSKMKKPVTSMLKKIISKLQTI